ncbi:FkbM family methyltransferase [uncultured Brachyspira sp.]|uniref:FkbM family methyltransferase n=1 Tax=uncultured Brachyspira sp. TaxID=221953 RepID=UPI0025E8428E|nr:FkbM family methyltransferase [uncultured Brachyspira sp.]
MLEKTKTEKMIDKKVWWISNSEKRNAVRYELLDKYSDIIQKEKSNNIKELKKEYKDKGMVLLNYGSYLSYMPQYYRRDYKGFFNDINDFKKNMDDEDFIYLECFLNQVKFSPIECNLRYLVFSNTSLNLITKEQEMVYFNSEYLYYEYKKKFDKIDFLGLDHLYFKSGLSYVPKKYIDTQLKDSIFIDGGGFIGDTAILFSQYEFSSIYSFEPDENNYNIMKDNIIKYKKDNIIPCNLGISDKNEKLYINSNGSVDSGATFLSASRNVSKYADIVKLDDYLKDRKNRVGLIKLDIEGFEENALIGAEKIIREDKPILLIAAYHDWVAFGQMFRIKKWIENLDLGYKIMFRFDDVSNLLTRCLVCYIE